MSYGENMIVISYQAPSTRHFFITITGGGGLGLNTKNCHHRDCKYISLALWSFIKEISWNSFHLGPSCQINYAKERRNQENY